MDYIKSPHSIKNRNKDEKNIFRHFIMESGLSVRATNVLLSNIESLEAFENLTEEALYALPNCGEKTVKEILSLLNALGWQGMIKTPISKEALFLEPPIDSTIEMLPVFSNKPVDQFTSNDLHPGFQGALKLENLKLSYRTSNVLNQTQMKTIGDVMLTTARDLLSLKNFGRKSLDEIKEVVRSLCKTGNYIPANQGIEADAIDYSSYENLFQSYCRLCIKTERNRLLVKKMFLFDTEKGPTLEEVGLHFDITRERVRQIVNKALLNFRHIANIRNLEKFWDSVDRAISGGGGMIYLKDLPGLLQKTFNWPTPPNPIALGLFFGIRKNGAAYKSLNDLITVECDCLTCETPVAFFKFLDFSDHDSFHVAVLEMKLGAFCQKQCPWGRRIESFHKAFIEKKVNDCNGFVLHEDLVVSREKWLETYCSKHEDVAQHILECAGRPMHFTEIAELIRRKNSNFKELSDHSLHASLIRYDTFKIVDRGTYGLSSWKINEYRSVSTAIEDFLDARGLPQRRQEIIRHLEGEFKSSNINSALVIETRFKNIGEGIYDRQDNWQKRTVEDFIKLLPEPVAQFARYLTGRNNTSYKLVMAFIFIRSMDETGAIYLHALKTMFYNFYLSRHKKGLVVEAESAIIHRIDELNKNEIMNHSCKKPLESFLASGYFIRFSQNGKKLRLIDALLKQLGARTRDILIIAILKAVDDYFTSIIPQNFILETNSQTYPNISESVIEKISTDRFDTPDTRVKIKKKRRGKIKL